MNITYFCVDSACDTISKRVTQLRCLTLFVALLLLVSCLCDFVLFCLFVCFFHCSWSLCWKCGDGAAEASLVQKLMYAPVKKSGPPTVTISSGTKATPPVAPSARGATPNKAKAQIFSPPLPAPSVQELTKHLNPESPVATDPVLLKLLAYNRSRPRRDM